MEKDKVWCKKCIYCLKDTHRDPLDLPYAHTDTYYCQHVDSVQVYTSFDPVYGYTENGSMRYCSVLNSDGDCKNFEEIVDNDLGTIEIEILLPAVKSLEDTPEAPKSKWYKKVIDFILSMRPSSLLDH